MKRIINSADLDVLFSRWKQAELDCGELSQKFQAYFCSFLPGLGWEHFSDCLNLGNTKFALLNDCSFEDELYACRGEAFPVVLGLGFLFQLEEK